MNLTFEDYRKKTRACFLGKAVGGTLGMPFEGNVNTRNVTYYEPVPTEMVANDDLDLQVVWLEAIIENGLPVNRKYLADAWEAKVNYHFDEYGTAIRNIKNKMPAPMSGYFNNTFYAGMGAAIRAELWACLAPANPALAVKLAMEDGCVDHYSDGVDAIAFVAALESAAFVESDTRKLLDIGLSYIPKNSKLWNAVTDTINWYDEGGELFEIREKILARYGKCDWEKGNFNWTDAVINMAFTVLAWLCGEGDFSKCICYATNLGYDTDCTAGIIASILGIINPDCIEERWVKPIGTDIVLSYPILGMHSAKTIDGFCNMIDDVCLDIQEYYGTSLFKGMESKNPVGVWTKYQDMFDLPINYNPCESLLCIEPIAVNLVYPQKGTIVPGSSEEFKAIIINPSECDFKGSVSLTVPKDWNVEPNAFDIAVSSGEKAEISFKVSAPMTDEIPYLNLLKFNFNLSGIRFSTQAGLVLATPWLISEVGEIPQEINADAFKNAQVNYADSFVQKIPKGKKLIFAVDMKLPYHGKCLNRITAQGVPLMVWIDGEKVLCHENEYYTPAPHRRECAMELEMKEGWHRVYIAADNTECNSTELYFAVGNLGLKCWYKDIEYRKSKI